MGLIKCPIHGLTYNDENPRGCPACAADNKGRLSQSKVMEELARVSRRVDGVPDLPAETGTSWIARLRYAVPSYDQRKVVRIGAVVIGALLSTLFWLSRPRFVEQVSPAITEPADVRSFPVNTSQDVSVVFAILGTQPPGSHPTTRSVQRYSYGSGLYVDAINGRVYTLTIAVPNRSWRGLRVGSGEIETEGTLALLGTVAKGGDDPAPPPRASGSYQVYPSVEELPTRVFSVQVRPPNGCFDVAVELQPRLWGYVVDGDARSAVVATSNRSLEWVATEIRVTDRSRSGPVADRAC